MNYVDELGNFDKDTQDRMPLAEILWNNRVFDFLKGMDYSTVAFSSGYSFTEFENVDSYIKPSGSMSEFQNILITTTPLNLSLSDTNSQFDRHRNRISFILDKMHTAADVQSPKFVIAHIIQAVQQPLSKKPISRNNTK